MRRSVRAVVAALFLLFAGLFAGLFAAGCTGGGNRAPESRRGATPGRIISCAPNLTEMLFALGAGDRVIGVTRYCRFPAEAGTRPPLGDLFNPNLEAMVAARPDLIVFVPGSTKIPEFFANHPGPQLLQTNACETIADIQATLLALGAAVGDSARARAIVAAMNAGFDSIRAETRIRVGGDARPIRYLMVLGHEEGSLEQIYAVGQSTYLTELLALSGGINVVPHAAGRYPILNREALLEYDPDVILERHLGPASPDERRALESLWRSLPTLRAVREHRIVVQDDDHVTINGPDLVASGRTLARLLHPPTPPVRVAAPTGRTP